MSVVAPIGETTFDRMNFSLRRVQASGLVSVLLTALVSECIPLGRDPHKCPEERRECVDSGRNDDSCESDYEACQS